MEGVNHHSRQGQQMQQPGHGSYLVGLAVGRHLDQRQTLLRSPGVDQVQGRLGPSSPQKIVHSAKTLMSRTG